MEESEEFTQSPRAIGGHVDVHQVEDSCRAHLSSSVYSVVDRHG